MSMTDPVVVYPLPQYYRRDRLELLAGGPWLVVQPPTSGIIPVAVTGWGLLCAASLHSPIIVVGLVGLAGLASTLYGTAVLWRRRIQVCPKCLTGMARGATRCPACHFAEGA